MPRKSVWRLGLLGGARGAGALGQLAALAAAGRVLGTTDFATFLVANACARVAASLITAGYPKALLVETAGSRALATHGRALGAHASWLVLRGWMPAGAVASCVVAIAGGSGETVAIVASTTGLACGLALLRVAAETLRGLRRPVFAVSLEFTLPAAVSTAAALAAPLVQASWQVSFILGSTTVAATAAGALACNAQFGGPRRTRHLLSTREQAAFAVATGVEQSGVNLTIVVAGLALGVHDLPLVVVALRVIQSTNLVINVLSGEFAPGFASSFRAADANALQTLRLRTERLAVAIVTPLLFVLVLFAPDALRVFGVDAPDPAGARLTVAIFASGAAIRAACGLAADYLLMVRRERTHAVLSLSQLLLGALATLVFGLVFGPIGASIAMAAPSAISAIAMRHEVRGEEELLRATSRTQSSS